MKNKFRWDIPLPEEPGPEPELGKVFDDYSKFKQQISDMAEAALEKFFSTETGKAYLAEKGKKHIKKHS